MLGDPAAAEDAVQEAFVRAHRHLSRGASIDKPGAWLWTVTANLCRNEWRRRSRKPTAALDIEVADTTSGPEEAAVTTLANEYLAQLVLQLGWHRRAAVVLRHVVGLSYAEIAAALERPVGTVKADVHRGLQQLRNLIEEKGT